MAEIKEARDYQQQAIAAAVDFLKARPSKTIKGSSAILVLPTGAGKSLVISRIAAEVGKVVVMQPSVELLRQNFSQFIEDGGGASVYSASANSKSIGHVTFATLQSIYKIGHLFEGCKVIVDECHLYPAKQESMFGKFRADAKIVKTVGLTATPFRLDKDELKFLTRTQPKAFGDVIHVTQVQDVIEAGFWAPLKYKHVPFDASMLRMNKMRTDYDEESMKKANEANNVHERIVQGVENMRNPPDGHKRRRSILVFVPTVDEAKSLASKIKGARAVWGLMKTNERDEVIEGFKNFEIDVVVNVNVLSVGFNHPGLDAIICARPTMSLAWWYQAVGRGCRIDRTGWKQDCWVIDMTNNFNTFGRVENITVDELEGYGWAVMGTQHQRVFTNVPLWCPYAFTRETCHRIEEWKHCVRTQRQFDPSGKKIPRGYKPKRNLSPALT